MVKQGLKITHPYYLALKYCLKALENVEGWVLDVGCGVGVMAKEIKRLRPNLAVFGIDRDLQAIKLANQDPQGVDFRVEDAYRLPFTDGYFAATLSHHLLEHLENPAQALAEISRVTKKGGVIYASLPLERNWSSIHHWFYRLPAYKAMRIKYTGHVQQYTFQEIVKLFEEAGFTVSNYYWSGFCFNQTINFLYYLLAGLLQLPTSFLTGKDLLAKRNSWYGRLGAAIKRFLYLLMTLESLPIARVPQETVHFSGKKL